MLPRVSTFARVVVSLAAATALAHAFAGPPEALRFVGRTDLPDYKGDFDHFGADVAGKRLFLAGEDGGTLEVFDLASGAHLKTVPGMEQPHAIQYFASTNRLYVSNSGDGLSKVLDGSTYAVVDTVKLIPGADVMSYDPSENRLWFVTGGKNSSRKLSQTTVAEVAPASAKIVGQVTFDTDFTEGIVAEQSGHRLYVNVAGRSEVVVLDKATRQVLSTWPIKDGEHPSQIALDEKNRRLFIVTRKPFKLVVLNTENGATVASFAAPQRTNGMMFDAKNHRIYAAGDDYVGVWRQVSADHYEELAHVSSEKGAKTAVLVTEVNRLYVAVGGSDTAKAGLLSYEVIPAPPK
jgi:DNA-binding beta-propeller fold protein YncE